MNRRAFLHVLAGGAAGCLLPIEDLVPTILPKAVNITLAVVKSPDPASAVRKAVDLIGGIGSFVSRNDVVFVKPNISWDRIPKQAATTNPIVVETVIRMAFEAGAKKVIVADNCCNDARRTYVRSGIRSAAEKAGAKVLFTEKRKFVKMQIAGEVLGKWEIYREAIEADKIINIPIAKHHGLSGVTLSMKNMMGLIGGKRNLLHQKLPESIVDLTGFFKPALHILDAVRVLKAHGPQGGSLKDVEKLDTVAASTDPVKIDAFGITLFGKNPTDFPHIKIGEERGLGKSDFRDEGFKEINLG
ncbi:MAG: DUF362 domain-containing protein [Candidatus Krumholzibacteria bacterium]|nr:DUF362 domain-containing protein [Candidatus Krumholzibacteria bacterium]